MKDRHSYFTMVKNFGRTRTKRKKKKKGATKYCFFIDKLLILTQLKYLCLYEAFPIISGSLTLYSQPFLTYYDYGIYYSILIAIFHYYSWTWTFCKTVAIFSIFGVTLTVHDTKKIPNFPNLFCHHTIEGCIQSKHCDLILKSCYSLGVPNPRGHRLVPVLWPVRSQAAEQEVSGR